MLLAFAAERRTAACDCGAVAGGRLPRPAPPLSIDICGRPHCTEQQTRRGTGRLMGQTDGRTIDS